jgi:hypothetical protein
MKNVIYKICSYCGKEKPAVPQYFHRQSTASDGLKNQCKACIKFDRETYPPKLPTRDEIRDAIISEDRQQAKEKRLREVQTLKNRVFDAARKANYPGEGIWIDGLLINIPIRVCAGCEKQFPETADYFYADNRSGKYRGKCKECSKKALQKCR